MARRHSTKLPIIITETAYARAALAANMVGMSLAEFTEAALEVAVVQAAKQQSLDRYNQACRVAQEQNKSAPTLSEFFGEQRVPFVRRPAGVTKNQEGRPSSRHHQKATAAQSRSTAAKPGPKRPAATRSVASMARTREDPPVDLDEHRGTAWMHEEPPEDRWGPQPDEMPQPIRSGPKL